MPEYGDGMTNVVVEPARNVTDRRAARSTVVAIAVHLLLTGLGAVACVGLWYAYNRSQDSFASTWHPEGRLCDSCFQTRAYAIGFVIPVVIGLVISVGLVLRRESFRAAALWETFAYSMVLVAFGFLLIAESGSLAGTTLRSSALWTVAMLAGNAVVFAALNWPNASDDFHGSLK